MEQDFISRLTELLVSYFPQTEGGFNWPLFGIVFAIFLLAFLLTREFVCWFFKINTMVSTLKKIRKLLEEQPEKGKDNVQVIK